MVSILRDVQHPSASEEGDDFEGDKFWFYERHGNEIPSKIKKKYFSQTFLGDVLIFLT